MLASLAGSMRRRNLTPEEIAPSLLAVNQARCVPPLSESQVWKIARSIGKGSADDPLENLVEAALTPADLDLVNLGDVEPESVHWLWFPRLPLGKITLLEGDPGTGKSYVSLALAAALSTGRALPGGEARDPANVLLLVGEDDLDDTVVPRLIELGGDRSRITALVGGKVFDATGLAQLTQAVAVVQPALIVIDPLMAYLDGKLDINKANAVRSIMRPLGELAAQHRCAVLCLRHLTKSQRDHALYRGAGSIDFTAAARSALLAGVDPDDESRRAICHVKSNLAPKADNLGYRLDEHGFAWEGASNLTAGRILSAASEPDNQGQEAEAVTFLQAVLAEGPRPAKEVYEEAEQLRISKATLFRARDKLGVRTDRQSEAGGKRGSGGWVWTLPGAVQKTLL